MTVRHPALAEGLVDRLRAVVGLDGPAPDLPARARPGVVRRAAKALVRRAIAWYVDPVAHDTAQAVSRSVAAELRAGDDVGQLRVNLELLKAEFREVLATVEDLGRAVAPDAGLGGAATRMAELRESLRALEHRVRTLAARPGPDAGALPGPGPAAGLPPAPDPARPAPPGGATPAPGDTGPGSEPAGSDQAGFDYAGFDYAGFERRFRGSPEEIVASLRERYFDDLLEAGPVLDVGCGRGELLAALAAEGVKGQGVDTDADMVAEARGRGVEAHHGDGVAYLRSLPEGSLGAVVAVQVLEHLPFASVVELVGLARTRLRPGGVLLAETPNPASLVVLGNSYVLDPTHVRPLHPSLLGFLCEGAGFRTVELRWWAPAADYHLGMVQAAEAPPWVAEVNAAFTRLNEVLFGPQDYAVVATRP